MMILSRQARDKHRENSKKGSFSHSFISRVVFSAYYTWLMNSLVLQYEENEGAELTAAAAAAAAAAGGGKEKEEDAENYR